PRNSRVRINGTLNGLEESSLRRVRFRSIGIRTGWSKKPFEPRQHRVRALLRARAYDDGPGPQGKAAVGSIVAGFSGSLPTKLKTAPFPGCGQSPRRQARP